MDEKTTAAAVPPATHSAATPAVVGEQPTSTTSTKHPPFVISGRAGQAFNIDGEGFGSGGSLTISGRAITTTRWNDKSIKGVLPPDVQPGPVVILTGSDEQRGVFPQPKVVQKTTTTTVTETVKGT